MDATLIGYAGAAGIVVFGVRSAHAAVFRGEAASLNPIDFAVLSLAGALLAIYAVAVGDAVFLAANALSAMANVVVTIAAVRARRRHEPDIAS